MTKQQFIDAIAEETGKPKADIESTIEALTRKIADALATGDKVELRGLKIWFFCHTWRARSERLRDALHKFCNRAQFFLPSILSERLSGANSALENTWRQVNATHYGRRSTIA